MNEKLEIFKEIQKYDCTKCTQFFYKINDSERNDEIRNLAFQHLQSSGYYVKLRQKSKGERKLYQIETDTFFGTPEGLYNALIKENSVQKLKTYDLFLSHSSLDKDIVSNVVNAANDVGMNCYVDWISDNDFLKRSMVSNYTKEVLKARMECASKLLFLSTDNSRKSSWVSFELDYFQNEVKREIVMIIVDGKDAHKFRRIEINDLATL